MCPQEGDEIGTVPHPVDRGEEGRTAQSHSFFNGVGGTADVAGGFWKEGGTHDASAGAVTAGGVPPPPCVSGWRRAARGGGTHTCDCIIHLSTCGQ
jgi:hypothetical protein